MEAHVGKPAPDFEAPAVVDGEISKVSLKNYKGQWVILFWYPKDYTFVCPTEIIAFSDRAKEFEELNCQLIAASTDTEEVHLSWIKTPRKKGGLGHMRIPIMADTTKEIAARYGVLLKEAGVALRGLYLIDPEGIVQHITMNNLGIGRSVDEAKRMLQATQFVAEHGEVCPADWKPGSKSMVPDAERAMDYFGSADASKDPDESQSKLKTIHDKKEFEQLIKQNPKVVVDFMASWCGKCRQIAPFVEELQEKHPDIKFAKLDTADEKLEGLSADLAIKVLPTFKFYQDGKETGKQVVGYKKKPLAEAVGRLAK